MSACPPLHALEEVAAGRADGDGASFHLSQCPICRTKIEEIRQNNDLMHELSGLRRTGRLRRAGPIPVVAGYESLESIAQGGQGMVYKAVQKATKRCVALKLLIGGQFSTPRQRNRFEREVELAASLRHPNIVTVHDSGATPDGRPYLAMEFIAGRPLDAWAAQCRMNYAGSEAIRRIVGVFIKVCDAMSFAHSRGVLHRDLKPGNILVDDAGEPHVVDFGLAKGLDGTPGISATVTGEFMGTFTYAAPEQVSGDAMHVDTRTDVYALGVILYEALTGGHPYPVSGSLADLVRHILETEPARPSSICATIDADLETILLKSLSKNASRRYQSARDLGEDLRRYLANEPISARSDSTWYVLRKTARRHRTAVMGIALAFLLVLAFAVSMAVLAGRIELQRRRADSNAVTLARTLSDSNIEHGRTLELNNDTIHAEELLWREYFAERPNGAGMTTDGLNLSPAHWALWEVYSRHPCRWSLVSESGSPCTTALSPDGATVAAGDESGLIALWDVATRHRVATLEGHNSLVTKLLFTQDGRRLASTSCDNTARLWDVMDRRCLHVFSDTGRPGSPLRFSPDDSMLAMCLIDEGIALWEVATGQRRAVLKHTGPNVRVIAFHPNSKMLASGHDGGTIKIWNASNWTSTTAINAGVRSVLGLDFTPNGKLLMACGYESATTSVWEVGSWRQLPHLGRHGAEVLGIQISPDGDSLASRSLDRTIKLWEISTGRLVKTFIGHDGIATAFDFSADWRAMVSTGRDHSVRLWDLVPNLGFTTLGGHKGTVHSACFSADGTTVATAGEDGEIRLWDLASRKGLGALSGHTGVAASVCMRGDGLIASASHDMTVRLWDPKTTTCVATLRGHLKKANSVAFSPDGKLLASASDDPSIICWDVAMQRPIHELTGPRKRFSQVCFSPVGPLLASSDNEGSIRIWDAATGQAIHVLKGHEQPARCVCFSPDGQTLASGGDNWTVKLWDMRSGACRKTLEGHRHAVFGVAFNRDGRLLATCSSGGEIKLWDVDAGRCLATFGKEGEAIFGVAFAPRNSTLASWGTDGTVKLWDLTYFDRYIEGNQEFWRKRLGQ